MAKTKDTKQWFYVYMSGCAPCKKVTPLMDMAISCGLNIKKITFNDFRTQYPKAQVRGTPSIIHVDTEKQSIINSIDNAIVSPLIDLSSVAPELTTMTFSELLVERVNGAS